MVLVGLFFCESDEASGHHACMNGYLTTAHQPQDVAWGCGEKLQESPCRAWSCGEKTIAGGDKY